MGAIVVLAFVLSPVMVKKRRRRRAAEFVAPDWWLNFADENQSGYLVLF